MKITLKLIGFLAVFLSGCAGGSGFEATVISSEQTEVVVKGDKNIPSEWTQSVDPVPYLDVPASSSELKTNGTDATTPDKELEIIGGVGRGAIVSKVDQPPYGTPVPGKPHLVRSPFSDQGFVDVSGHPPETEVKCPYTGKIFLVP